MSPNLREFLEIDWSAEDLTSAQMTRKLVTNAISSFMQHYELLITPTLAVPPFELGIQGPTTINGQEVSPFAWIAFTFPFNMTGQPAISIPAGFTNTGLPVGIQIVGRHLDDPGVLRAAAAFEALRPWSDVWPAITIENA